MEKGSKNRGSVEGRKREITGLNELLSRVRAGMFE